MIYTDKTDIACLRSFAAVLSCPPILIIMAFLMYSFGDVILMAIAMVLIVEGIGPMLFANKWQHFLQQISQQPVNQLRTMGGILVTIGVVSLVYLL